MGTGTFGDVLWIAYNNGGIYGSFGGLNLSNYNALSVVLAAPNRSTLQLNRLKYNKLRTSYFSSYATGRGNHMYYVETSGLIWTGTGSSNNGYAYNPYSVVLGISK